MCSYLFIRDIETLFSLFFPIIICERIVLFLYNKSKIGRFALSSLKRDSITFSQNQFILYTDTYLHIIYNMYKWNLIVCHSHENIFIYSGLAAPGATLSPAQTFGSIRSLSGPREVASFPLSRTPSPPPLKYVKHIIYLMIPFLMPFNMECFNTEFQNQHMWYGEWIRFPNTIWRTSWNVFVCLFT